jgi:hypothetical protein
VSNAGRWVPLAASVAAAFLTAPFLGAVEKRGVAHEAEAIVVGTFSSFPTWPWFDGWHITGVITVQDGLYERDIPRTLHFHLTCKWSAHCEWWPAPSYPVYAKEKGVWFLWRSGQHEWGPSLGLSDSGFRPLGERAYWEDYIRRYKR